MLAWAAVCLALALLAKEVAVVFPALLLLYEAVLGRPLRAGRADLLWRVHLPLSAVAVVFLAYAAFHARYAYLFEYGLRLRSVYDNLLTQANVVVHAITLFVRPTQLNFEHDLPLATSILQGPTPWSIAAIAGLVVVAIVFARRAPLVAFGILWFFLHLLPTNSVLPRYDLLSERNLYLPSIGLYLTATAFLVAIARRFVDGMATGRMARWFGTHGRTLSGALVAALALGLAGLTASRNAVYADPVAFWSDAIAKSPHKSRPHANLGVAFYARGDLERALEQFRIALALDPLDPVTQRNLLETWNRLTDAAAQQRP
jgi:tetratricopeptide (TPR) repeat protein